MLSSLQFMIPANKLICCITPQSISLCGMNIATMNVVSHGQNSKHHPNWYSIINSQQTFVAPDFFFKSGNSGNLVHVDTQSPAQCTMYHCTFFHSLHYFALRI